MNYKSQFGQDEFALKQTNFKKEGFYIDIGCGEPSFINNTYVLEKDYYWSGLSIDKDKKRTDKWNGVRSTQNLYNESVFDLDISSILKEMNAPNLIDYLSMDLEPPDLTFQALDVIPWSEYKIKIVTYEHDSYRNNSKYVEPSRKFFTEKGYTRYDLSFLKPSVSRIEDWWILNE
jgi:hypothetical protein